MRSNSTRNCLVAATPASRVLPVEIRTRDAGVAATLLCLIFALGCQSPRVADSLLPQLAGNEPERQLDFWHTLAVKPLVSNDEAFHALLLYIDGKDDAQTYSD